jgi:hypothetical protein
MLSERYFERLKRPINEILGSSVLAWNISDAIKKKCENVLVSFGGAHVYDAVKSLGDVNSDYPFDTVYGGDFHTYSLLTEMILKMSDNEIESFVSRLCSAEKSEIYLQQYNNKLVLKNLAYNIAFPHENVSDLAIIYLRRFKNFKKLLLSNASVTLVYSTHWEKVSISVVNYTLNVLKKYNKNVKFFIINSVEKSDNKDILTESIYFPDEYKNRDWSQNKVAYDQSVFRNSVIEAIKKYV